MMYQKLVRDNIPAIIEKNGETCVTRKLTDKEYEDALAEKLQEEVKELLEVYTAKERSVLDCAEEMADVMEVLYAMGKTCMGTYNAINNQIMDLIDMLDGNYPGHLTQVQRGEFFIGYNQQMHYNRDAAIAKKREKEENTIAMSAVNTVATVDETTVA